MSDKLTIAAAVNGGELSKDAAAGLEKLLAEKMAAGHTVLIVDPLANTLQGVNILAARLRDVGVDSYTEIWVSPGNPPADLYVIPNSRAVVYYDA